MTSDILLDAFGLIDDQFLVETPPRRNIHRAAVLLAAVISLVILSVGTALAVSEDFREAIFSIFRIETVESPPQIVPEPTGEGLREVDIVQIDEEVTAHYFASDDLILRQEGGFYTCNRGNSVPEDTAYWQIQEKGIVKVEAMRYDFPLDYGGRTLRILFDCAVLNGKLVINVWPQGLDENPVMNGWNVTPIGSRTDAALLSIPTLIGDYASFHYFLLDLTTMEITALLTQERVDCCWFTEDLRYAIVLVEGVYTFLDMETGETNDFGPARDPYFLDNETLVCKVMNSEDIFDLVRIHIPTGVRTVLAEDINRANYRTIQQNSGQGIRCLLFGDDGTVTLLNQMTGDRLVMTGLAKGFTASESPNGSHVMIASRDENRLTLLGILDPDSGLLKLLPRNPVGNEEYFTGWLDENSLMISSAVEGGINVYIYRFAE